MKKALRYTDIVVSVAGCLALGSAVVSKRQQIKLRQQVAAQDRMLLPSESQRLMQLADTLTASQRAALLRQHNLAPLFRLSEYPMVQNGFIGPTPQRLEVVFKEAAPDARYPGCYHVEGLSRAKGHIQALQGFIALRQIRYVWDRTTKTYTATGLFHFMQSARPGQPAATWRGVVAIDFEVRNGRPQLFKEEGAMLPISRGFAFEGARSAATGGKPQRVVWANEFGPLGSAILKDFGPGGRSQDIDPRYYKYGWNEYWENDEWWADSPRPKLNL